MPDQEAFLSFFSDDQSEEESPCYIKLWNWTCVLEKRFTPRWVAVVARIDPNKLSTYWQMTLLHYAAIKEWRLSLTMSLVKRLRSIFTKILETSYLENPEWNQEAKEYYKELLDERHLIADFLMNKIGWLYSKAMDGIASQEEKEGDLPQHMKALEFYRYLVQGLASLIRYFEEYAFIQKNRNNYNFWAIIQKYRHTLLWWVNRYKSIMRVNEQDDLYQEFCLVLWKCVNTWVGFASEINNKPELLWFTPYLKNALRNKCTDIWRWNESNKRKVHGLTVGDLDDEGDSFTSRLVAKQITNAWIRDQSLQEEE